MQPLKLGLLNYILKAQGQGDCRDIVFVPVGLNYDRVPEEKSLLANRDSGFRDKGRFYATLSFLRVAVSMAPRMIGLSKPFGTVVANFGRPLSLADWEREQGSDLACLDGEQRRAAVTALGEDLRSRIETLVPLLPVSLLAQVLLDSGDEAAVSELELKSAAMAFATDLRRAGAAVSLPPESADREFSQAIYLLLKRAYVVYDQRQCLRLTPAGRPALEYYRGVLPAACSGPGADLSRWEN